MRIVTSNLAAGLLLLVGNGLALYGQAPPPPRGTPDDTPPPVSPDRRPVRTPDGRVPPGPPDGRRPVRPTEGGQPSAAPQGADIDELMKEYDTNGDGYLSERELPPSLRQSFKRIDTDGNGRISRKELEQGILHMHPQSPPSDFIFALIEMSAVDPRTQTEVQRVYQVLRKLDKNQDGKIDEDELRVGQQQIVKDRIAFLFKELDADNDGRISKAEARGQLRQDFNHLDANRDGFIDRDELMRAATARPSAGTGRQTGLERAPQPTDRDTVPPRGTRPVSPDAPPPPARVPGRVPPRRVPQDDGVPPPPR